MRMPAFAAILAAVSAAGAAMGAPLVTMQMSGLDPLVLNGWVQNSATGDDGNAGLRPGFGSPAALTVGPNGRIVVAADMTPPTQIGSTILMDPSGTYANNAANNAAVAYQQNSARVAHFNSYDASNTARNHWRYSSATGNVAPNSVVAFYMSDYGYSLHELGHATYNPATQTVFSLRYTGGGQTRNVGEWQPRNLSDVLATDDNPEGDGNPSTLRGVALASQTVFSSDRDGIAYDWKTGTSNAGTAAEAFNLLTLDTAGTVRLLPVGALTAGTSSTFGSRSYGTEVLLGSVAAALPAGATAAEIKVNPASADLYVLSNDAAAMRVYLSAFSYTAVSGGLGAQIDLDPVAAGVNSIELTWHSGAPGVSDGIPDLLRSVSFDFSADGRTMYVANHGYNDGQNNYNQGGAIFVFSVPEPATMALLGLGALPLLRRRRRR